MSNPNSKPKPKPKYTPGPWAVQYADEIIDGRGIKLCHVSSSLYKTGSVPGVFNEADYRDERNANARLIAAAPDGYKAVSEFIPWFKEFIGTETFNEISHPAFKALFDFLAKAEGRES